MDNTNSSPAAAPSAPGKKGQRKCPKSNKPKMTKEDRRAKYTAIARDRRNANLARKRDKTLQCFRCRKSGHTAENCKEVGNGNAGDGDNKNKPKQKSGGNICYKCGSIEHRIQQCPKIKPFLKNAQGKFNRIDFGKLGDLPFANCYVCNQSGHLASHCPDNDKGLYPQGGSCRECGSVKHYAADCPEKYKKKEEKDGDDASDSNSVTIDEYLDVDEPVAKVEEAKSEKKKKKKVVKF